MNRLSREDWVLMAQIALALAVLCGALYLGWRMYVSYWDGLNDMFRQD